MSEPQVTMRVTDTGEDGYILGFKEDWNSFVGLRDVNKEKLRKARWKADLSPRVAAVDLIAVGGLEKNEWFSLCRDLGY